MKRGTKKGQFNFAWLFAIIAGGAILFLAIYGATKSGDTARYQSDTEIAKSISILTDPLQAGYTEGSYGSMKFKDETRITNVCLPGGFGKNDLSVSTRSDMGEEWKPAGGATSVHNKYIFSPEQNSGVDYYVFSKPFKFPYKVADLVFLISDNYCFLGAPDEIAGELSAFSIPNIEIDNCTRPDSIKVCFKSEPHCDISVEGDCTDCDSDFDKGIIRKQDSSQDVYYVGNLMYAAIFSDKNNYDCNVKRLMYRDKKIAEELSEKATLMGSRGCSTALKPDLIDWQNQMNSTQPADIQDLYSQSTDMNKKNEREICNLW